MGKGTYTPFWATLQTTPSMGSLKVPAHDKNARTPITNAHPPIEKGEYWRPCGDSANFAAWPLC